MTTTNKGCQALLLRRYPVNDRSILDRVITRLDDIATSEDVVITAVEQQREKRQYRGEYE